MGNRWKRQQDVVCMYGTVNCAGTDGPLDAQAIIDAHNADCAGYEARIAELEATVARVKAESLRVVPDGNRCLLRHATSDYVLADDRHIYQREDGDWWSLRDRFQFLVGVDMFVQPVRLERWEEQG